MRCPGSSIGFQPRLIISICFALRYPLSRDAALVHPASLLQDPLNSQVIG